MSVLRWSLYTQTYPHRQTGRQAGRQTHTYTGIHTRTQTDINTHTHQHGNRVTDTYTQAYRHRQTHIHRHTDTHPGIHTWTQTHRHTHTQAYIHGQRHTYRHTHTDTDRYTSPRAPHPCIPGWCSEFQASWVYGVRPCVKTEDNFCPHIVRLIDLTPYCSHSSNSLEHVLGFLHQPQCEEHTSSNMVYLNTTLGSCHKVHIPMVQHYITGLMTWRPSPSFTAPNQCSCWVLETLWWSKQCRVNSNWLGLWLEVCLSWAPSILCRPLTHLGAHRVPQRQGKLRGLLDFAIKSILTAGTVSADLFQC
jgi:hypothetical protein